MAFREMRVIKANPSGKTTALLRARAWKFESTGKCENTSSIDKKQIPGDPSFGSVAPTPADISEKMACCRKNLQESKVAA